MQLNYTIYSTEILANNLLFMKKCMTDNHLKIVGSADYGEGGCRI